MVNFALIAPVLFGLAAGTMDMVQFNQQKAALQAAADAASLAAVREATLKGWNSTVADSVAQAVLSENIHLQENDKDYYTASTSVDEKNRQISVKIDMDHYPFFTASFFPSPQISVDAVASAGGSTNICVIGLDEKQSQTVSLADGAQMTAPSCAVYSNSAATDGLASTDDAFLNSELTCSAGGTLGRSANFEKAPVTNCPAIADPLASRPAPTIPAGCDFNALSIKGKKASTTLSPGVYCNGLTIKANASVTFEPGEYIIKDGPFTLSANAAMYGRGAGFYFTGKGATFSLESGSTVDLEAPEVGSLAGLLFYQDRSADEADFTLRSNKASVMVGTIYLPNGNFIIDTNSKVADTSAYTAIVSRTLTLMREPNVVLNTDYDATTVPVPAGIGSSDSGAVRLLN